MEHRVQQDVLHEVQQEEPKALQAHLKNFQLNPFGLSTQAEPRTFPRGNTSPEHVKISPNQLTNLQSTREILNQRNKDLSLYGSLKTRFWRP